MLHIYTFINVTTSHKLKVKSVFYTKSNW